MVSYKCLSIPSSFLDLSFLILLNLFPAALVVAARSVFVPAIYPAMVLKVGYTLEQPGGF